MLLSSKTHVFSDDVTRETVGDGIERQILGHGETILMVRVWFDEGAEGYAHEHEHAQVSYVESGEFEFTVGEKSELLKAGDSAYIAPNISHGATCRSKGVLLDVFSPARLDFIEAGNGA